MSIWNRGWMSMVFLKENDISDFFSMFFLPENSFGFAHFDGFEFRLI